MGCTRPGAPVRRPAGPAERRMISACAEPATSVTYYSARLQVCLVNPLATPGVSTVMPRNS